MCSAGSTAPRDGLTLIAGARLLASCRRRDHALARPAGTAEARTHRAHPSRQFSRRIAVNPLRRGACPSIADPMPTGDGLLVRLMPPAPMSLDAFMALCDASQTHGNGIMEVTQRGSLQVRGLSSDSAVLFARTAAALGLGPEGGPAILAPPLYGLDAEESIDLPAFSAALRAELGREPCCQSARSEGLRADRRWRRLASGRRAGRLTIAGGKRVSISLEHGRKCRRVRESWLGRAAPRGQSPRACPDGHRPPRPRQRERETLPMTPTGTRFGHRSRACSPRERRRRRGHGPNPSAPTG